MKPIEFNRDESYAVAVVDGHPYLFTDLRITRESVPEELFVYDIADGDGDGCFARIQPFVMVNYWGTIIGKHELPLENGAYYPEYGTAEYEGTYVGEATLDEYMQADEEDYSIEEDEADGEYSVHPGNKYTLNCAISGTHDEETFNTFKECAEENLECCGVKVLAFNAEPDPENGQTKLEVMIAAEQVVRTVELYDNILYAADENGMVFEDGEFFADPVK